MRDRKGLEGRPLLAGLATVVAAALFMTLLASAPAGAAEQPAVVHPGIRFGAGGTAPVIVQLRAPASTVAVERVLAQLRGTDHRVNRRFDVIPFVAVEVGREALDRLSRSPLVAGIEPDDLLEAGLAESTKIVKAPDVHAGGFTGAGQTVAVIDSGVDKAHPMLQGKVVAEACYARKETSGMKPWMGECPNGLASQTGSGSGVPCGLADGCPHGTHVAGIAAGRKVRLPGSTTDIQGVAPDANVISVQVFHRSTKCQSGEGADPDGTGPLPTECGRVWKSDYIKGMEYVYSLRGSFKIAAVNLSLGGGGSDGHCDDAEPSVKTIVDNLRQASIATVAASGNDSAVARVWSPACVSSVVAVGNTRDDDTLNPTSNSGTALDLLAPGTNIWSAIPGDDYGHWEGTSMAAPNVAGGFALLKQAHPWAGVSTILKKLSNSPKFVRTGNGTYKPRIDLWTTYRNLGVTIGDGGLAETNGVAYFVIALPEPAPTAMSVTLRTIDGSAVSPGDYKALSTSVRYGISAGATHRFIPVSIVDDSVPERTETFTVEIASFSYSGWRVTDGQAVGTIYDYDK